MFTGMLANNAQITHQNKSSFSTLLSQALYQPPNTSSTTLFPLGPRTPPGLKEDWKEPRAGPSNTRVPTAQNHC